MPKIGLLIDTLIGGGAERITLNLYDAFTELGHEAHIFLVANKIEHNLPDIPADRLHWLSEDGKISRNKVLNKLLLAQRLRKLVHGIESGQSQPFAFFISSAEDMDRLTRIAGMANVLIRYRNSMWVYLQNKIKNREGIKRKWRNWQFLRKFRAIYGGRHIVTVSHALIEDIVDKVGVRPKSIRTIYNPFNFSLYRSKAQEPSDYPDEPYILYLARFENRKRHDLLVRAFHKANPDCKLVLMGGVYTKSDQDELAMIRQLIQELGLEGKVLLPGFRSNPYPWIKHARLFAMSSDSEGLPTVLIESLILGTPVVSTDCPTGPSEILTGEFSRFLSPIGDADTLADNLREALSNYPEINEGLIAKYHHLEVAHQYIAHATQLFRR